MLEIFLERDGLAAGLLHARIARKDFESRAETGEDGIRTDDTFFGKAWHPLVDAARQFLQHVPPIADLIHGHRAVRCSHAVGRRDGRKKRAPRNCIARSLPGRSVSIGHDAVIHPASIQSLPAAGSPIRWLSLCAKTTNPIPDGLRTRRLSVIAIFIRFSKYLSRL